MPVNTNFNFVGPNPDVNIPSSIANDSPTTPSSAGTAQPPTSVPSASRSLDAPVKGDPSATLQSQAKQKRVRTSKPKVKTGCTNCKQRRIKCDEVRPSCTQCVRSKKLCTGYPPPTRGSRPFEEIRIAPKPLLAQAQANAPIELSPFHSSDVVLPPRRVRQRIAQRNAVALASSPNTYQPSISLRLPPAEGPYFEIFRTHTANELSGYFDFEFWTRRVLQECHTEAAIKHAVIALGALYQTLEQTAEPAARDPLGANDRQQAVLGHWQIAIKRYSDACNALVGLNSQDQKSNKTLIMANVLLACFDSFIGDHRQAIKQIQTGLGLLERLRTQQQDRLLASPSAPPEDPLEEELVTMFTRLAIQAKSYDMAFHFPQPFVIRLTSPRTATTPSDTPTSPSSSGIGSPPSVIEPLGFPENFTSLLQARLACDRLNERIMRYIEGLYAVKTDQKGTLPQSWRDYGLEFKSQIESWCDAFDNMFNSRHSSSIKPQEKAAIAALKMLATNSQVLYLMMFSDQESDFDAFLPQFQSIVDLGVEIVADEEERAAALCGPKLDQCQHHHKHHHPPQQEGTMFSGPGYTAPHIRPRFSADLGIVAPLFVVATKCRDPVTRRQAIQLLRSSARRESMWDSQMVAHIGTWVMNLEESETIAMDGQPVLITGAGPISRVIPEEKRVMIRSVDFDLRARVADLQVGTRGLQPNLPDPKFRQTRITW
ncbi:hypothetical protein B0J13DRAFT_619940 [Dactylonectria estremocensis]|uniref:Zn(2)-C6 fungal-type domain-containing protein n=1 Tax=Dactylonectria estremocensis TaxID=1079267 RepID=A0A9P9F3W7_9HYPO|nr:hypothetical protein B0J13DRAFT_619940 [Dactylonectria estremocensis]